ncbi:hypothetical protein [Reyranella sp.]|uniref:hypothetical protein n=1 Tax=Reyranella sp. TaxID=1929291 RepID=UPI001225C801|nr:hypothetical protein [Reyranella sp.]TAJ87496.1 MAG: hypothetical protein EPO50_10945 [Reyranella sp.]
MPMALIAAKRVLFGLLGAMTATTAMAQTAAQTPTKVPRSVVETSATQPVPEFRDPKTGQVWTQNNVGTSPIGKPTPADLAFDPLGQATRIDGVVIQRPAVALLGWSPPSAGPNVPLVSLDNASLSAIAGKRWQVALYVNNNANGIMLPMIDCRFTNAGKTVQETRVLVPALGAGIRAGVLIYGPKTDLFVDRAHCRIVSP